MKKQQLILFFLFTLLPCAVWSQNAAPQNYTIKGVLMDSLTNESEPYATIRITTTANPTKAVKMAVTDMKGKFQEKMSAVPGKYVIAISSIGKTTVMKEFTLETGTTTIDLGTLFTTEATNELKGVEILAQKPLVRVDVDKIEYNIEDDPDSKTSNILEMLRKVPLVTVDGEDKIQVNGSSSFKIHVNGKPNTMMSSNPTDVLKSMPANTIKYIEVITSPGAKYDAEGVAGILNIVTVGGGIEGYSATFSGRAGNQGAGAGTYATVKKDKLTLSANYNYNYNERPKSYNSSTREDYTSTDQKYLDTDGTSKNTGSFQYGNLEASYEIDTLRLITVSAGLWGGRNESNSNGQTTMYDATRLIKAYSYKANNLGVGSWYSIQGSIDYQRTSKRNKARMLTLSYKVDTEPSDNDNTSVYTERFQAPDYIEDLRSDGHTNTTEQTFQVDYTTPIGKIHTVESGVKYILRNSTSENDVFKADVIDMDRTSHYENMNNILAAYLGYTLRYKKYSFKPGLRYEYTMQDINFLKGRGENFNKTYNDLVPSVSLGWKVGMMQNLTANYNMRISRPGIWYLNPYFNDTNPMNISKGNPFLDTEKAHNFSLGFSSFTSKFNLNLSLNHSFNNNAIERVTILAKEEIPIEGHVIPKGAMYSTYENIGKNQRTGMSLYVNWNASSKTRIYMNASGNYIDVSSPKQMLHNYGWAGSAYGGIQHTFPWQLRASLNGGGSTPYISLQGEGTGYYYYSLSVSRSFLKERLTLSTYCNNVFNEYLTFSNTTQGPNFLSTSKNRVPFRSFGISISYRIGELKASVKKTARSISNDDVKGGGDNTGGGSGGGQGTGN